MCIASVCVCDLKTAQINMQHNLIQKIMLHQFALGYNTMEVIKNICYTKSEGAVDHSNQMVEKKFLGWKNLND